MKIVCAPPEYDFKTTSSDLNVILYGRTTDGVVGSAGAAILETIRRQKLQTDPRAWDFLSIALSVASSDLAGHRGASADGWTRELDLHIAVSDKNFWDTQKETLESILKFLSTDRWSINFLDAGAVPPTIISPVHPEGDCAVLLSGGLDSFTGILDLVSEGFCPVAVSQSVRGDAEKQKELTAIAGSNIRHIQMNHNVSVPDQEGQPSQRARSMIFFAYGILAATSLAKYHAGGTIALYVCENGFITMNPPLTDCRIGSLSTRTCNPVLLALLHQMLTAAGLRVSIVNPYRFSTKGEMLINCQNQDVLLANAHKTTSCGRFKRYGYKHCGRCVPCMIRRSSFLAWGVDDQTEYVFADLSIKNKEHAGFDDVRSAAIAIATVEDSGMERWLGATLASPLISDKDQLKGVISRGLNEVKALLNYFGIQ